MRCSTISSRSTSVFASTTTNGYRSWNLRPRTSCGKVTIPNPEHFFEQAEQLVRSSGSSRPRQVDYRRAISNAYYGVFHATLTAAADTVVGRGARLSAHYLLVYRSVDHQVLRKLCEEIQRVIPSTR